MPSLDKAFSRFLKTLRGEQSYASLAKRLGISESTLHRPINGDQSATLRGVENTFGGSDWLLLTYLERKLTAGGAVAADSQTKESAPQLLVSLRFR